MLSIFKNCACALARTLISRLRPIADLLLFFTRYVEVTTGANRSRSRMHIAENMKKSILCHFISFMSFCGCFCVFFSGFEEIIFFVVLYFHALQSNYIENNTSHG